MSIVKSSYPGRKHWSPTGHPKMPDCVIGLLNTGLPSLYVRSRPVLQRWMGRPPAGPFVWIMGFYAIMENKAFFRERWDLSNMPKDLDVAKRAKVIEWLKTEVVDNVSRLFKALWEGSTAKVGDSLASLMMSSYILARRLGMSYRDLDDLLIEKLKKHKQEGHQLEDWYQDISTLEEHLRKR